jgi:alkylation response protein AidB-like acyl-CoA dehydrogenase
MDLRYNAEQDAFRASLRGFLADQAPPSRVREAAAADGHDRTLWHRLCSELELPALHAPQEYGGTGATLAETAIVFGELGRALTAVPFAATTFAIDAILRAGDDEQCKRLLAGLVSGDRIGALAASGPDPFAATVRAQRLDGRVVLTGECTPVLHGHVADVFVVPAVSAVQDEPDGQESRVVLHVVAACDPGVAVVPLRSFDATRPVAKLQLAQAPAEALTAGSPDHLERLFDVARVLLAAEMLGGAEACLDLAVAYARSRKQFERPIGSFQAVKHLCADMMIELDATRAAVLFAAMSAANGDELRITAPLAKAQAADTYVLCAGSAIQVHGGIAFTWQHDLHLYFRRAKTTEALFGSTACHRALLADRAGL